MPITLGAVVRPGHLRATPHAATPPPPTFRTMGDHWLPYSAAALASGAVALVLGTLGLPMTSDDAALLQSAQLEEGRWLMAAAAFLLCSVGLGMGLPTFLFVMPVRGRRFGYLGTAALGLSTMSIAAYAALLLFFQALVVEGVIGADDVAGLGDDRGVLGFSFLLVGSFYAGEALLAVGLFRARSVPRWVPALLGLHVLMLPFTGAVPALGDLGAVVIGVAFMGVAVHANERFQLGRVSTIA